MEITEGCEYDSHRADPQDPIGNRGAHQFDGTSCMSISTWVTSIGMGGEANSDTATGIVDVRGLDRCRPLYGTTLGGTISRTDLCLEASDKLNVVAPVKVWCVPTRRRLKLEIQLARLDHGFSIRRKLGFDYCHHGCRSIARV